MHKSTFNLYCSTPSHQSVASKTMTVSSSSSLSTSNSGQIDSSSRQAATSSVNNVLSIRPSRPVVPVCISIRRAVCCLSIRLQQDIDQEASGPPVIIIEPLVQFINRTGEALLCKPIVAPNVKRNDANWTLEEVGSFYNGSC